MAYDEALAARVRDLLGGEPEVEERSMFGGLAFLVSGAMAVAVSGRGGLMVRVHPDDPTAEVAQPVVMRGAPVRGWVAVDVTAADGVLDEEALSAWVRRGVERARSL